MSSGFNLNDPGSSPLESAPIEGRPGGRYRFRRTRIYGRLHFVKSVPPDGDYISRAALRKEFEIGYNLDHPGIVRYLMIKDDAVYEEYIDGISLRDMLDSDDPRLHNRDAHPGRAAPRPKT